MTTPHRYSLVHESRAEYALPLPASLPDMAELVDTVRTALRTDGRSTSEARLDTREGELVVSYTVPDTDQSEAGAVARRKLGFA